MFEPVEGRHLVMWDGSKEIKPAGSGKQVNGRTIKRTAGAVAPDSKADSRPAWK